jgi:PmbA protein
MPDHEIFEQRSVSAKMAFSGGELKVKEYDELSGFGVRALEGGRLGFAYCQQESQLGNAVKEAARMARFSVKSGFSFAQPAKCGNPDITERAFEEPDFEMLRAFVEDTRSAAEAKGGKARVISSIESDSVSLRNTSGLDSSYPRTVFSIYAECMHGDGFGYSFLTSHHLPPDLHALGGRAAEMAKDMQGAGKPDGGLYTVVMELESLDSLIETLIPSFSGDWKRRGMTRLSEGKKLSEKLTIMEDGLSAGINARPFDDEGTPSRKRPLIEDGAVKAFLYDRETAALSGAQDSGACTRESFDSPPSIGASNLVIPPGDVKDLSELGKHIEVHYAHGSHTANLTTGDIGLEVSGAFLVEGGKRKPVKGFMLSGNVFDMFSSIEALEARQRAFGSLISPRIAFSSVRVVS